MKTPKQAVGESIPRISGVISFFSGCGLLDLGFEDSGFEILFVNEIQKEFGSFDTYLWSFVGSKTIDQAFNQLSDYPTHTAESDALAKDLKKRGFKFMGTTVCYAYMQAVGLVNDHQKNCFKRKA